MTEVRLDQGAGLLPATALMGLIGPADTAAEARAAAEPAPPHLVVAIADRRQSLDLVRYGAGMAARLGARWTVLHVRPAKRRAVAPGDGGIEAALSLARDLGAETMLLDSGRIGRQILQIARQHRATHLVVGKSRRWPARLGFAHGALGDTLSRRLRRQDDPIQVHLVGLGDQPEPWAREAGWSATAFSPLPYLIATALITATVILGVPLRGTISVAMMTLLFLTEIIMLSIGFGLLPALFASLIASLACDYYFLQPYGELNIDNIRDLTSFVCLAATAVLTSNLTSRMRDQMLRARRRAHRMAQLNAFGRKLVGHLSRDQLLTATAYQIAASLPAWVVILVQGEDDLVPAAACPQDLSLGPAAWAAARWTWDQGRPSRAGQGDPTGAEWLFVRFRAAHGPVGVVGVHRSRLTAEDRSLLETFLDQAGLALDRLDLAEEINRTRMLQETERLRSALLSSISHDLRTPLATIHGIVTSLAEDGPRFTPDTRKDLLETAIGETDRLNRFVGNLLDTTRLEAGAIEVRREPVDLGDVVEGAAGRAGRVLARHRLSIGLDPTASMVSGDYLMLEQCLFNLLDNAAKYAPPGTLIRITSRSEPGAVVLMIADEGPGIPLADQERIFDRFYRARPDDRQRAGTGLGLAVCRGFIEAQGGTITAANRESGPGAVFTIRLPAAASLPN